MSLIVGTRRIRNAGSRGRPGQQPRGDEADRRVEIVLVHVQLALGRAPKPMHHRRALGCWTAGLCAPFRQVPTLSAPLSRLPSPRPQRFRCAPDRRPLTSRQGSRFSPIIHRLHVLAPAAATDFSHIPRPTVLLATIRLRYPRLDQPGHHDPFASFPYLRPAAASARRCSSTPCSAYSGRSTGLSRTGGCWHAHRSGR